MGVRGGCRYRDVWGVGASVRGGWCRGVWGVGASGKSGGIGICGV